METVAVVLMVRQLERLGERVDRGGAAGRGAAAGSVPGVRQSWPAHHLGRTAQSLRAGAPGDVGGPAAVRAPAMCR